MSDADVVAIGGVMFLGGIFVGVIGAEILAIIRILRRAAESTTNSEPNPEAPHEP